MNLIEGSYRLNRKEYRQFVGIARGSSGEIMYQLLLSRDLGYISDEEYKSSKGEYERVAKMLTKLASSLKENLILRTASHESRIPIKKYLTSFLRSGIELKNFNLIVFFLHKIKGERR